VPLPLRDELLELLADIANGRSYLEVHQDTAGDGLSAEGRAELEAELAHVEAARTAVLESVPQLVDKALAEQTPGGLVLVVGPLLRRSHSAWERRLSALPLPRSRTGIWPARDASRRAP